MIFSPFNNGHYWFGKMIGAFMGYLMAGPLGAFLGILVGNFFDQGLAASLARPHRPFYSEKRSQTQKIFFESTFLVMGHIAKADGRVSEREIEVVKTLMDELGLTRQQKEDAKHLFNLGKQPAFNLKPTLQRLYQSCRHNRPLLKVFLDLQYRVAIADNFGPPKLQQLNEVFSQLGFAPLNQQSRFYQDYANAFNENYNAYQQYRQNQHQSHYGRYQQSSTRAQTTLEQAYAVLELNSSASKAEVKKAYRRLMSANHPDKLIAKGLPESMIKIANEKTQAISKAYDQICKSKGW